MKLLVTGGAGYIGSIVAARLLEDDHEVVVLDNLQQGHREAVPLPARLVEADLLDREAVLLTLGEGFDAVLHFAALALVGESVSHPERYYRTNVGGTLNLLEAMTTAGVSRLVFSSTCAVYGQPDEVPIAETALPQPTNPYGASKLAVDRMISDFSAAHGIGAVSLRYFNVAGASGELGEDHDPETHLIPNVLKAALGISSRVEIFGTDYPTPDGTAIRDYIHIDDLAVAHVLALAGTRKGEHRIFNLGNGNGFSVREVISAAQEVTGREIPTVEAPRRPGDPPELVAASARIRSELGWKPQKPTLAGDGRRRVGVRAGPSATDTHSRSASSASAASRTRSGGCVASIVRIRSGSSAASCSYAAAIRAKNCSSSSSRRSNDCARVWRRERPSAGSSASSSVRSGCRSFVANRLISRTRADPECPSASLVGERGIDEAIEEDPRPGGQQRLERLLDELCPCRRVEQRLGARPDAQRWILHELAHPFRGGDAAGLAQDYGIDPASPERVGQSGCERGLARSIEAFDRDQLSASHDRGATLPGGSIESSAAGARKSSSRPGRADARPSRPTRRHRTRTCSTAPAARASARRRERSRPSCWRPGRRTQTARAPGSIRGRTRT